MGLRWTPTPSILRTQLRHGGRISPRWNSTISRDALRILFCGSDEFSIASLKALRTEQLQRPHTIESIEVICRPGKRVGRRLKEIREVPIKDAAAKLGLQIHELDTFTGWTPPNGPVDLIIAVSFGLFVPSRLLNAARYGGLNVHPSLLPDFRGPAPLHHTLLAGRTKTGITLQTLHHKHFDHGVILDQTPAPGIDIPNPETCTVPELLDLMSRKSAEMLVKGIRERIFVPPLTDAGWREAEGVDDLIHATKIKTEDRHVDWQHWTWMDISRRLRVLGPLWSIALVPVKSSDGGFTFQKKRIILSKIEEAPKHVQGSEKMALVPGVPFVPMRVPEFSSQDDEALFSYTADGRLLRLREIKVEGQVFKNGLAAARKAHMLSDRSVRLGDAEFSLFHNPLF